MPEQPAVPPATDSGNGSSYDSSLWCIQEHGMARQASPEARKPPLRRKPSGSNTSNQSGGSKPADQ